ncbi:DUF3995 domain-containing protein [Bacillus sp. ISL-35]|uniref:DUF3995 domain-containing protein n=1 Tax=Bacillus sp. ISL-35 TaxID=2819122 RepID=UPI001BE60871|nr:DUF3995 domain-containing protein [Bacillus sp. ISL-35]MBT2678093.1 DUF3995 domain-containing protein [Bacillus sp. ISL-35]MBT2702622.1 DUF3995 domain-containing protein [Chryseobacterium sp. ISL-80]
MKKVLRFWGNQYTDVMTEDDENRRSDKLLKSLIGVTSLIFLFIGMLHIFWAFGGSWGVNAALPTEDDSKLPVLQPRMFGTLFIGLLCFFAFVLLLVQIDLFAVIQSSTLSKWFCIAGGIVFLLRAIGEGKYVGFFKKIKHTRFAKLDTAFYSPLCVWLSFIFLLASFI